MVDSSSGPSEDGTAERQVVIINAEGMHARPSHLFVLTANRYACEVELGLGDRRVNGKSIMMIMTLAAECGARLTIRAKGEGATAAVEALAALVASGFKA